MNTETKQERLCLILAAAGAVLALLFAGLWLFSRHDQSDAARTAQLVQAKCPGGTAQAEAAVCRDAWKTFGETGKDSDALPALASLYAFARDMEPLMDGTSRAEYPSYCMAVFRLLTEKPELRAAYASALEKQFDMLAKDIYRVNAYAELKKLIPALESGILPETGTEPVSETEGVLTAVNRRGDCAYA